VVGRTLALRRAFGRLLWPRRALPRYLQDTNERAEASEQRYYQDIENESVHGSRRARVRTLKPPRQAFAFVLPELRYQPGPARLVETK
jgi:hypothetical protein